jgi:hypothetical protein
MEKGFVTRDICKSDQKIQFQEQVSITKYIKNYILYNKKKTFIVKNIHN